MTVPSGWTMATIGDIAEYIQRGKSPKYCETSKLAVINQRCIRWTRLDEQHLKYIDPSQFESWDQARYVVAGDVLWNSTGTGTVGRAYHLKETDCNLPRVTDSHVTIVRVGKEIESRFLFAWIRGPQVQDKIYAMCDGSTNQVELSRSSISNLDIPLAPYAEQQRIADKLDTVLARVDACRDRLARVALLLKRFRQSVLDAGMSGRLTDNWRRDSLTSFKNRYQTTSVDVSYQHVITAPEQWRRRRFSDVIELIGGSQPPKTEFISVEAEDTVRLIQIRDYKSDKYKVFIPRKLARRFCSRHDVMIGRYGPPIFQILRGLEGAYNVALMKAVPKEGQLNLEYLYYMLQRNDLLRFVEAGSDRTSGQDGVRKEHLEAYPVFVPSLPEQLEIVRRVETLFAYADRLEGRLSQAQTAVDRLTPALLAKAFRGELVPQDPADEPAAELLKRLAAARGEAPTKPRRAARNP